MKKKIFGVLVLLFTFFIGVDVFSAASCKVSVQGSTTAYVGDNIRLSVLASSNSSLGTFEYTLSYDSSVAKLTSGSLHIVDYQHVGQSKATNSYTFKALKTGTVTFKPVNVSVLDFDGNECLQGSSGLTVTIKNKEQKEVVTKNYSKNNNLSSLSIDGATLSPSFDKNVTEYNVTMKAGTEKINVKATSEDNKATVSGIGEVSVKEGLNKIDVVVLAENKDKKTYTINVNVEEKDPINVLVNGKKYTVVRKNENIENVPAGFNETKVTINDEEVVAYENKSINLVLVALQSEKGGISLFIYDQKNNKYKEFNVASNNGINLLILDKFEDSIPKGFIKKEISIGNNKVIAYKFRFDEKNNYYIVYAMNLEDGNKNIYLYDKEENTFQRYYDTYDNFKNNIIIYMAFALIIIIGLIFLVLIIKLLKKIFTSKEKKINKLNKKINNLKKSQVKEYDEELDDEPVIREIKEDSKPLKKNRKEKRKELQDAKNFLDKDKTSIRRVSLEPDDMDDYDF